MRDQKRGNEKKSRLAGAGGAAESALMNDHAHSVKRKADGVEGDKLCVHTT